MRTGKIKERGRAALFVSSLERRAYERGAGTMRIYGFGDFQP
jgi:hypothetical protein